MSTCLRSVGPNKVSSIQLWQFWSALILIGLGWNFAFIGATGHGREELPSVREEQVQGFHDFVLFDSARLLPLRGRVPRMGLGCAQLAGIPGGRAQPCRACGAGREARRLASGAR